MRAPIFVVALALALVLASAEVFVLENLSTLRQLCPNYCWLGTNDRIDAIIESKCTAAGVGVKRCTRFRNENGKGKMGTGRTCDCGNPLPPAVTPTPPATAPPPTTAPTVAPPTTAPTTPPPTVAPPTTPPPTTVNPPTRIPPGIPTPPASPRPFGVPTTSDLVRCGAMVVSGTASLSEFAVYVAVTSGTVDFMWNHYTSPDRMVVSYQDNNLFDTGLVSGDGTQSISFSGASTFINVTVSAPGQDTAWDFVLGCP